MKSKITLEVKNIIILIIAILMIRFAIVSFPTIQPRLQECAYSYLTSTLTEANVSDIKKNALRNTNFQVYYVGRGSCIDCRDAIKNVISISKITEENTGTSLVYVALKDKITENERNYLDEICVDEIPVILLVNHGSVQKFGYYDIISEDYKDRFIKLMEGD